MQRLAQDAAFAGVDLQGAVDPSKLTGRSAEQVDEFINEVVRPIRNRYADKKAAGSEVRV